MKVTTFWHITLCSLVKVDMRYSGSNCSIIVSKLRLLKWVCCSPWWWRQQKPRKLKSTFTRLLSTHHELIPTRNAVLAAVQGSASNVGCYLTWKHSPLKEKWTRLLQCLSCPMFAFRLLITTSLYRWSVGSLPSTSPRTALRPFTPRKVQLVICGQYTSQYPRRMSSSIIDIYCDW
jgi:hypothetical protein